MSDTPSRFRIIEGGGKPKPYRARKRTDPELLTCAECEKDTGTSSTITFEGKIGRLIRDGKPEGGTKAVYCLRCLGRGKLTQLI